MKNMLSVVLPAYNEGLMIGKPAGFFGKYWKEQEFPTNWFW